MLDYTTIGKNIRTLRSKLGVTQATFAEALDVTPDYISKIENASKHPSLRALDTIADVLDVDISALISGTDPKQSNYLEPELASIIKDWEPETKLLLKQTAETFNDIDRQLKDSKNKI